MKIFYISQVGTLNYLLPLFYYLKKKNQNFYIIIQKKAFIKEVNKFNYLKITKRYKIENCFKKIIKKEPDHLLLSATGEDNEKKLIQFAKQNGIKSSSIIDIWTNYKERFTYNKKLFLPNNILCIDIKNVIEMKKLNFPLNRLKIIGNPYLEKFIGSKVGKGKNILFISQPVSTRIRNANFNEYNFYNLVKNFLDYKKIKNSVHLLLHPEEKNNSHFLKKFFKGYKIKIFSQITINYDAYFLVIGMFSTELIKYYILNKKVIIFDINKKNYLSPLARWKLAPVVKNEKELYSELINFKKNKKIKNNKFLSLKGSLKRLIDFI